jgi:hypothetical protein
MPDPTSNGEGQTLWEMLKGKLNKGDSAIPFHNPLDFRVGSLVPLSKGHPEFGSFDFTVKEIREYTRRIGRKEFKFADYVLAGTNTKTFDSEDALIVRLRVVPNQAGANDVLLLRLYDEIAFDEDFLAVVKDTTGLFEINDDAGKAEQYHRINDVRDSYEAVVLIVTGTTDDGKAADGKAQPVKLEYWDYWREMSIAAAAAKKQFLFVEMNSDSGWFQIWRGEEFFL